MYAEIVCTTSATATNAMDAIIAVMTGETDINNLPTECITGSRIDTTYRAGGWELFDTVSATEKVVRAAYSDKPAEYKYIKFTAVETASPYVYYDVYRDWDDVGNTGTLNRRVAYTTIVSGADQGKVFYRSTSPVPTTCYISSSDKHFAAIIQHDGDVSNMQLVSERTRINEWDTPASQFNPICYTNYGICGNTFIQSGTGGRIYRDVFSYETLPLVGGSPRDINSTTSTDAYWGITTSIGASYFNSTTPTTVALGYTIRAPKNVQDAATIPTRTVVGFGAANAINGYFGGSISAMSGIYYTNDSGLINEDFTSNGINYKIWQLPATTTTTVGAPSTSDNANVQSRVHRFLIPNG